MADRLVRLQSNGKYWTGVWSDSQGRRRARSLGPKRKVSRRQARVLCDRLAAEMHLNPGRANARKAPKLGEFVRYYLTSRTDLKPKSLELHGLTARYLQKFFGHDIRIDRITRSEAAKWRSALARGDGISDRPAKPMVEASVCIHVRTAKTIFNIAVRDDLLLFNPFDRLRGNSPEPDKDWHYVSMEDLNRLLDACPNWGWRLLIALCRLAGLRRGEAFNLTWDAVDWKKHRLRVIAEKTGRLRTVPVEPELYELLLEAFGQAEEGQKSICPISDYCLWRNFQVIRERAGLARWKDAFKVLRRNRETDWAQEYPQYVVSRWMGHDIRVSDRHYLQVPEELYEKVAKANESQNATKSATNSDVAEGEDSQVLVNANRGDWIRTSDFLLPKQAL